MHKAIKTALAAQRLGMRIRHKWIITGTERSRDGGLDQDHSTEYACTREEAWAQALAHAAGTRFTPERIELE